MHVTGTVLASAALSLLATAPVRANTSPPAPSALPLPNIVLIVADDLGWHDVNWHRAANELQLYTPALDSLADTGTRLEHFYVAPVCTPSRMALLTGRYPVRWGMQDWVINDCLSDYGIPRTEETIPEFLAQNGYLARLAVGKWHLGGRYSKYHPINNGFSEFLGNYTGVVTYDTLYSGNQPDWHDGFEIVTSTPPCVPPLPPDCSHTDRVGRRAKEFIDAHANEPFFLYVPFLAVHHDSDDDKRTDYIQRLSEMDANIGLILGALDTNYIAEKTIVWFLSDNGGSELYGADNYPLHGEKSQTYDGGIRSVSVIRYPNGNLPTADEPDLISHVDVFPTLVGFIEDAVGPVGAFFNTLDGRDMSDYIDGGVTQFPPCDIAQSAACASTPPPCKEHFSYVEKPISATQTSYRYSVIRHDPGVATDLTDDKLWKVVLNINTPFDFQVGSGPPYAGPAELYELIADESEEYEITDPAYNSIKQSLIESLSCWLALDAGDRPPPLPLPDENDPFPGWHFRDINTECSEIMLAYRESPTDQHQKFAVLHASGNIEEFNDTRNLPDGKDGLMLQGIGRSRLDGLLYGITVDGQDLYQFDGTELTALDELNGLVLHLGAVRDMPPTGVNISAGDVAPDGKSYFCFDDAGKRLYSIDLANLAASLEETLGNVKIADFTFDSLGNMLMYDEIADVVLVRDPAGVMTSYGPFAALGSTGAVWLGAGPDLVYDDLVVLKRVTTSPFLPAGLYLLDLNAQTTDLVFTIPSGWDVVDGAGCFEGCIAPGDQCAIDDCCEVPPLPE